MVHVEERTVFTWTATSSALKKKNQLSKLQYKFSAKLQACLVDFKLASKTETTIFEIEKSIFVKKNKQKNLFSPQSLFAHLSVSLSLFFLIPYFV